jgi:multiple sugar transport system substrate-binding protein
MLMAFDWKDVRSSTRWRVRAVLSALVAGASRLGFGPSASAQENASISFAFWGDPAEEEAYNRLVEEFKSLNPGIDVEIRYTPDQGDYQTKISTSFAGGASPDVFLINYREFGQYAARGALESLGSYLDGSDVLSEADFHDVPMAAFSYRGAGLTCIPQNISSLVVYYNADMFEANGVPLPTADWTRQDFVDAAVALTKDTNGDGATDIHGLVVEPSMIRYVSFIWGSGGEVVDNLDNPTTLTIDTPEALDGINWFISLGQTGYKVTPTEAEVLAEDDTSRFMNGRAAMLMQSRRVVPTLRQIKDFTWDVAPLPAGEKAATVLHSDAFCMSVSADHKDAAWKFIEYAVGEQGQTILAETGRTVPSMKSVAESDVFLKGSQIGALGMGLPPTSSQVFLDVIPTIRRVPSISTWPEIEDAFNVAFKRAFYVEIDVEGAIEVTTFQSRDAFARALEEDQIRDEEFGT